MKKSLITGAALIAFTVALTLISGLAQAQSLSSRASKVEEADGEADVRPNGRFASEFVATASIYAGSCIVGPRSGDVIFTCFGLGFPAASPRTVHCQIRNSPADPTPYADQFSCQVTATIPGAVTVRIRRMDDGTSASGWGQDIRMNLLIVN